MLTSMAHLTIDLSALRHNCRVLKNLCAPGVRFMGVVKADAYGHGLVPAARALAGAGADYLGVGGLDEGQALRQAGLDLPILLLLGILPEEAAGAAAGDMEVVLYRRDVAQALDAAARSQGKRAFAHVKVDTGMGRLGMAPEEVLPFLEALQPLTHLKVLGPR